MPKYNGHKNRNFWNVSLWISNDEGLYRLAKDALESTGNKEAAARMILNTLTLEGKTKTPDGTPYTKTAILEAIRGL